MNQSKVQFGEYNMTRHNMYYHRAWVDDYLWRVSSGIKKDPLWQGRFYVRRLCSKFELFEDGSGGLLYVKIRFYDRKTHMKKDIWTDALDMQNNMFIWMNNFIVEDVKVWEKETPYDDPPTWLKRKSLENF